MMTYTMNDIEIDNTHIDIKYMYLYVVNFSSVNGERMNRKQKEASSNMHILCMKKYQPKILDEGGGSPGSWESIWTLVNGTIQCNRKKYIENFPFK